MSIRKRVFLATLTAVAILLLSVFFVTSSIINSIIDRWTLQYAEREVTHTIRRAVEPIRSDLAIILDISKDHQILDWANNPGDAYLRRQGLEYLNGSRFKLNSSSYFIALKKDNSYFYNDLISDNTDDEFRYNLSPQNKNDQWFYSTLQMEKNFNLNIDFDRGIESTRLWVNAQIRNDGEVLGVIGTGFEIDYFLRNYLYDSDARFENFFVDKDGAIQLANNRSLIVNAAIAIDEKNKPKIFDYLSSNDDITRLQRALQNSEDLKIVDIDWFGQDVILFATYLPDLEWYSITAIDASTVLSRRDFISLYATLATFALISAVGGLLAVAWYVDRPIQLIARSIDLMATPGYKKPNASKVPWEYRKLLSRIENFAFFDPLTGLLNRRGLADRYASLGELFEHSNGYFSVAVIDLDHFKSFNDTHGHSLGDVLLRNFAEELQNVYHSKSDIKARFGGEEFIVITSSDKRTECAEILKGFIESLREIPLCSDKYKNGIHITASAGIITTEVNKFQTMRLDDLINIADKLLYQAKKSRDCVESAHI